MELQNSPTKLEELLSRENFYKKMFWIVNGQGFIKNFSISPYKLPPPGSVLAMDLDILREPDHSGKGSLPPIIMRKSKGTKGSWGVAYDLDGCVAGSGSYDNSKGVIDEIDEVYEGHHFFHGKIKGKFGIDLPSRSL